MTNHLTNFPFIIKFLSLDHKEICKLSKIDFKYYGSFFFLFYQLNNTKKDNAMHI